jgi:hypothetical protein
MAEVILREIFKKGNMKNGKIWERKRKKKKDEGKSTRLKIYKKGALKRE